MINKGVMIIIKTAARRTPFEGTGNFKKETNKLRIAHCYFMAHCESQRTCVIALKFSSPTAAGKIMLEIRSGI